MQAPLPIKPTKDFGKKVLINTVLTLIIGLIINAVLNWGDLEKILRDLDTYTALSAMFIVLGKIIGSLNPTMEVAYTTIASPSLGSRVEPVRKRGWEETLSGWTALITGIILAILISTTIKTLLT